MQFLGKCDQDSAFSWKFIWIAKVGNNSDGIIKRHNEHYSSSQWFEIALLPTGWSTRTKNKLNVQEAVDGNAWSCCLTSKISRLESFRFFRFEICKNHNFHVSVPNRNDSEERFMKVIRDIANVILLHTVNCDGKRCVVCLLNNNCYEIW